MLNFYQTLTFLGANFRFFKLQTAFEKLGRIPDGHIKSHWLLWQETITLLAVLKPFFVGSP